ncbi:hypothetical protein [Natrialba sp. INN-245]|uniref:hypothetical protein n=1 Tax=Natrialba sp. INN-245 TaxID=2690967 RepID=UPI0013137250|nr:hypothetical protein [Natrialba sp. INN-245]MWV40342.1 hypothetical protein [Natrialba sp. INN-245]
MNRRVFLGIGATFVGAGALLQTGAFHSVTASRGVAVSAATDPNALLGIDRSEYPPTFTNNTENLSMAVTLESDALEFDVDGNGNFEEPASFDLAHGESREVELDGEDGPATISVDLSSDGTAVGSIELERSFDVPQVAAIREVVGSVDRAGNSGKYEFSLINEGGDPVTLDGFGVDWTDPNAAQVGGGPGNSDSILEAEGTQVVDQIISVGGGIVDVISGESVTLPPDTDVEFEFNRFRDENGDNFGVDDADLVVRAEDGSSAVVELRVSG